MNANQVFDHSEFVRPAPLVDQFTQGFWDAIEQGFLAVQCCAACKRFQHPPRSTCRECGSADVPFQQVSGKGSIWSFTTTRHGVVAAFDKVLPYVCVVVALDEQPGLFFVTDFAGREEQIEKLCIGDAVQVEIIEYVNGIKLPQFTIKQEGQ